MNGTKQTEQSEHDLLIIPYDLNRIIDFSSLYVYRKVVDVATKKCVYFKETFTGNFPFGNS